MSEADFASMMGPVALHLLGDALNRKVARPVTSSYSVAPPVPFRCPAVSCCVGASRRWSAVAIQPATRIRGA